jgi:uncharacterized C2H2 Zn-finger protein
MNRASLAGRTPDPDRCPRDPQESAEAYLLGHLRPDEARGFEDHYLACGRCAAVFEESRAFVTAMKQAAGRLCRSGKGPRVRGAATARSGGARGS